MSRHTSLPNTPGVAMDMDYLLVSAVIFVGACLQGAGGVGFGMFVAPILALWHPELLPGPLLVLGGCLAGMSAVREHQSIDFKGLRYALAGRIPSSFAGSLAFSVLPVTLLSVVFAVLILLAVLLSFLGWRVTPTPRNLFTAGLASGFMGTITSVGAPPMAIVMQNVPPAQLRATLGAFFVVGAVISIVALAWVGRFGLVELKYGFALVLPLLCGFALSNQLAARIRREHIRLLVLWMSGLAAAALLVRQLV